MLIIDCFDVVCLLTDIMLIIDCFDVVCFAVETAVSETEIQVFTCDLLTCIWNWYRRSKTHKRFKITLFIKTKHNMQIFGVIPFIEL